MDSKSKTQIMKKTITLILVLFLINLSIKAQGNLQYNKVVLVTFSGIYTGNSVDTVFTVPVGKVWKVESGMAGNINYSSYTFNLFLDGKPISGSTYSSNYPIWLPPGTYTLSGTCAQTAGLYMKGAISAIEYNEVP